MTLQDLVSYYIATCGVIAYYYDDINKQLENMEKWSRNQKRTFLPRAITYKNPKISNRRINNLQRLNQPSRRGTSERYVPCVRC